MFDLFTKSRFRGRPIELYRFTYGTTVIRYTDAEMPITHAGEVYTPTAIDRGVTENAGTLDRSSMEIKVPRDASVAELYRIYPPSKPVLVTIYEGEAEDPDAEFKAFWHGRVTGCGWSGSETKLSAEPISTSMVRVGLRRNYQYMCPHVLYGPKCQANKAAVSTGAVVEAITGRVVRINALLPDSGHYPGGMIEWGDESRTILSTDGQNFTLTGITPTLSVGDTVAVVKGCDHTLPACRSIHANNLRFGGQPWIPLKNPISNVSPY